LPESLAQCEKDDARRVEEPNRTKSSHSCGRNPRRRTTCRGRKTVSEISGIFGTAAVALALAFTSTPSYAGDIVGLITKTNTNPYFAKMKQGFDKASRTFGKRARKL
jgi:hypothetical protein